MNRVRGIERAALTIVSLLLDCNTQVLSRCQLYNQRLFLPAEIHLLVLPVIIRLMMELNVKFPQHTCEHKAGLDITKTAFKDNQ